MPKILGFFDFSGEGIAERLQGNKTHLVVAGLIALNWLLGDPAGADGAITELKDTLWLALISTGRAAVQGFQDQVVAVLEDGLDRVSGTLDVVAEDGGTE